MVPEKPEQFPDWKVENGRLYCHRPNAFTDPIIPDLEAWKLVLPLDLRNKAIEEVHAMPASGHLGIEKIHARLALLCYWPGMFRDVATYVRACVDKHLPDFCFAYNTAVHSLTDVSPAFLNFGREPKWAKSLKVKEEGTPLITPLSAED